MKTLSCILVFFAVAVMPLCAQSYMEFLGTVSPSYRSGFVTGMVIDVIGYGLVAAGAAVSTIEPDALGPLLGIGTLTMTVGGLVQNVTLGRVESALRPAGTPVPDDARRPSWTLEWVTVGCMGIAVVAVATEFAGDATGWVVLGSTAGALISEAVNFFSVRHAWVVALAAANKEKPVSSLDVVPVIGLALVDPATRELGLRLGLDLVL